jgi:hypothetical protein
VLNAGFADLRLRSGMSGARYAWAEAEQRFVVTHLEAFHGVLQVDGYAGFERLTARGDIVRRVAARSGLYK